MKRIGGLIVFCIYFGTFFSQLTENFSDGDFNNNPKWTGDTLEFIVNSDFKLQLLQILTLLTYVLKQVLLILMPIFIGNFILNSISLPQIITMLGTI